MVCLPTTLDLTVLFLSTTHYPPPHHHHLRRLFHSPTATVPPPLHLFTNSLSSTFSLLTSSPASPFSFLSRQSVGVLSLPFITSARTAVCLFHCSFKLHHRLNLATRQCSTLVVAVVVCFSLLFLPQCCEYSFPLFLLFDSLQSQSPLSPRAGEDTDTLLLNISISMYSV